MHLQLQAVTAYFPQSPDINVIENLWSMIEKVVQKHKIASRDHLKRILQKEWAKISSDRPKKLVESMLQCLEAIIKAKRHVTKY